MGDKVVPVKVDKDAIHVKLCLSTFSVSDFVVKIPRYNDYFSSFYYEKNCNVAHFGEWSEERPRINLTLKERKAIRLKNRTEARWVRDPDAPTGRKLVPVPDLDKYGWEIYGNRLVWGEYNHTAVG